MKKVIAFVISLLLATTMTLPAYAAQSAEIHTVKVAFDYINGYQTRDDEGNYGGYAYEMLQYMKIYAPWRYEYVGYEDSFTHNLNRILTGEADMTLSAIKTPEREQLYDFSDESIGVSIDVIMVSTLREMPCVVGDYSTYNGLRIGVVGTQDAPSIQHDSLSAFAQAKGFAYEETYYPSFGALAAALKDGEVDAIASTHMLLMEDMNIIDQIATHEIFVMVKKGNTQLLEEINYSLNQVNANSPNLQAVLKSKYYPSTMDGKSVLTAAESQYIQRCRQNGTVFTAVVNPNAAPLSYYENGQAVGLNVDIAKEIMKRSGLSIRMLYPKNQAEYQKMALTADLLLDMHWNLNLGEQAGLTLTEPYYSSTISRLTRKDNSNAQDIVAVVTNSNISYSFIPTVALDKTLLYYDTVNDTIEAVLSGKADCTYLYSDIAQSAVYRDELNRLTSVVMPIYKEKFCIGVRESLNHYLSAIVNKAALSIDDDDILRLSAPYINLSQRTMSIWAYLYQSPTRMAVASLILIIVISLIAILVLTHRQRKQEQALIRELRDANATKTDFLSRISHDMRTPMNAIIGFSDIGQDSNTMEEAKACFDKVNTAAKYLLGMMNDVLDMSRIESGKAELKCEPYCYQEFEDTLKTILIPRAEEKGIRLMFKRNLPPSSIAYVDKQRFQQIFVNLISNAIKFTPDGGWVEMNSELIQGINGMQIARITVSDNGIGISEDFIKNKMFHAFEQEHRIETSREHGTGLGLSIVSKLVDLMDGTISCKSELGVGTTFTVEIPVKIAEEYGETQQAEQEIQTVDLTGKRVLLCEDHPLNTQIALRLLQKVGAQVVCAANGEQGVEAFRQSKEGDFCAVLMDIRMPVMDGFAATAAIRGLDRHDAKTVPIIAMTANAFVQDADESLNAGMNAHLCKPIEPQKLYATLSKFCGRQ